MSDIFSRFRAEKESHIRPEIRALIERGNSTLAEYNDLRCNSWEWEALVPALSIEALIAATEHTIKNCSRARSPALTYDEAIHSVYTPELIKRLKALAETSTGDLAAHITDQKLCGVDAKGEPSKNE